MREIKSIIVKWSLYLIPKMVKEWVINEASLNDSLRSFKNESFSQEGEDVLLNRIMTNKSEGYYVDVGAMHPHRFSNTFFFYRKGWRGINIEPRPGSKLLFDESRPRDINLELGVSSIPQKMDYYSFKQSAYNTCYVERAMSLQKEGHGAPSVVEIAAYPLSEILSRYLPEGQQIDFLSVDVEGHDYEVIKSNDWNRFRPTYLFVEILGSKIEDILVSDLHQFLDSNEYELLAKSYNTCLYQTNHLPRNI